MGGTLTSHDDELLRLWGRCRPAVAAFIASAVPDFHAAQDLLQDVAAALVEEFHRYDPARPFNAWAMGVAKNKVLAHWRRTGLKRVAFDSEAIARIADAAVELDREDGPYGEAVERCLGKLPARARRLLELRYEDDLRPAEIASRVGAGVNAVTVALHRLREKLRDCIRSYVAAAPARGGGSERTATTKRRKAPPP
jgi:RNA polymerase sigma-70 factor (ECF subfamily)